MRLGRAARAWAGARPCHLWVLRFVALLIAAQMLTPGPPAMALELTRMQALASGQTSPPAADRAWTEVGLPRPTVTSPGLPRSEAVWYRTRFIAPALAEREGSWAVYLPYLYEGGQVWLNGIQVGEVEEDSDAVHVRWERPHLISLPRQMLRAGDNVLEIRAAASPSSGSQRFPVVSVAPRAELLPVHDRRLFWVRTLPEITVVVCLLMAAIVLCIWWRRRSEVLYGLFGLASALWGIRTLTFVIERMPSHYWHLWRTVYLGATGGFVVVLALFSMRLAGIERPWLRRVLLGYWLLGPVGLLLAGAQAEPMVNRWWSAGLIPIGLAIVAVSIRTVARRRTLAAAVMPTALMIAVLAGVHDYLIAWEDGALAHLLPHWIGKRIFLLHHAANLLLLCMGGLLTARFVHTMDSLEELNRTLESRVADRESHLAESFARMAQLQRRHAVSQERQSIMREIHDGLGSRLFTSLSRVERGDMSERQIADVLRDCIADMRIALDALAPDAGDFRTALGNFLFRWQAQLEEASIHPSWTIDVPDRVAELSAQASLQLLRIAQEALTNVLKHARARGVRVQLRQRGELLELEIADDGRPTGTAPSVGGRGIANMHARARQLGASLEVVHSATGTRVLLRVPSAAHTASGVVHSE